MGYVYLIKYNNEVIAVAEDDECATMAIYQYMKNNKDIDIKLFEKVPVRYFRRNLDETEDKEDA